MTIRIEDRHIIAGQRCNCARCPIALAIAEATGHPVRVDNTHVYGLPNTPFVGVPLPYSARKFVALFDQYRKVELIAFELAYEAAWKPAQEVAA